MSAVESLTNLVNRWSGTPTADTSADSLAELGIDPAEFQRAQPLRRALHEVGTYLQSVLSDSAIVNKIGELPSALEKRIDQLAANIDDILSEMHQKWKAAQPNIGPSRWDARQYTAQASAVEARHADLFQLLEPLREVRSSDVRSEMDALRDLINQSFRERESTKGTTEQLKETAAYVLTDITVDELDSAIEAHSRSAKRWLVILFVSALVAFRLAWWVNIPEDKIIWCWGPMFPQPTVPLDTLGVTVNLGRKILLLSAAFAVPLLALRVYYTNLHNLVVNRQRKISVNAFSKLYALMKEADIGTKTELVKQAAQTIFAQGPTGFLSKGRNDLPLSQLVSSLTK